MSLARRLEDEVVSFLRATRRAPDPIPEAGPPPCLLVAVSGGGDSTALLKLLHATRLRHGFGLIAAHVHHGVRPDADEEERRVASLCGRLEIPFEVARLDRRGGRPSPGEATLRELRYAALRRIARDRGCRAIVLGHQRDDQIETVLMALMRGTGIEGIAGMRRRRGDLLRPLLHVPRSVLRDYLREAGEAWVEDPTNEDPTRARNQVRARLLPLLEDLRPGSSAAVARSARALGDARAALRRLSGEALERLRMPAREGTIVLDATALRRQPRAIVHLTLKRAAEETRAVAGCSRTDIPASAWRAILRAVAKGKPASFRLPGPIVVDVTGRAVRLSPAHAEAGAGKGDLTGGTSSSDPPFVEFVLPWSGEISVPLEGGLPGRPGSPSLCESRLRAELMDRPAESKWILRGTTRMQIFDADGLVPPVRMRPMRSGDRVAVEWTGPPRSHESPAGRTSPGGRGGDRPECEDSSASRKLSDLLSELGVPRSARRTQPVIEDRDGILWAPGVRRSARARVGGATRRIWVLRWSGPLPVDEALTGGGSRRWPNG